MERFIIRGGKSLRGRIRISGSKNAALPIMAASILFEGNLFLENVPELKDIEVMEKTLRNLGVGIGRRDNTLNITAPCLPEGEVSPELANKLRASILVLGPLLAKKGRARIALPGGCNIGNRPIDLHIKGLSLMGATIEVKDGFVQAKASFPLKGNTIELTFPSVGATENILMAASFARGTTVIKNASCAPEVVDLCQFLQKAGARIKGAGTRTLIIEGVKALFPVSHRIIPDRIETGTFAMAAAITGGEVLLEDVEPEHLKEPLFVLKNMGVEIEVEKNRIFAKGRFPLRAVRVETLPYPGFPTDLQPQLTSLCCLAEGESEITENIFEDRFSHVPELRKMGALITREERRIRVKKTDSLKSTKLVAPDIRAGASLVLAALAAEGTTEILHPHHIDRGYEKFEEKLSFLGADIKRQV